RQDKQANVSLFLGPRLFELAEEQAEMAGKPMRYYLEDILKKHILELAGPRTERYKAEFTTEHKIRTSTWRPDSEKEQEPGFGRQSRRRDEDSDERSFGERSEEYVGEDSEEGSEERFREGSEDRSDERSGDRWRSDSQNEDERTDFKRDIDSEVSELS